MHPESNLYEVGEPRGFVAWCGLISSAVFVIAGVVLVVSVWLAMRDGFWTGLHFAVLSTLVAAPVGLLAGIVGLSRPSGASIIGSLGNLLLIGLDFVIMVAISGI